MSDAVRMCSLILPKAKSVPSVTVGTSARLDCSAFSSSACLIPIDSAGDKIYGKIMVSPLQSLGHSFELFIEKCFLCTGFDGYIPRYDPDNEDYGCIAESANLRYVIKIIVSIVLSPQL